MWMQAKGLGSSASDWQLQRSGGQWCRAKTFDTFCPLGPCLVTRDDIPEPNNLKIATILNGQRVQDWNTADMIFDVPHLMEAGIVDPTKVTRSALQNAASIAGILLLTTECMITEIPEKEKAPAMAPGGGMDY